MSTKAYHHGDLREALVAAALAIVERDGAAALSLRGAARAAGVSAMAPYHHFRDREALVAAVAQAGFERLYADKLAALATGSGDATAMVVAGARAYVGFILDNPELYRLMKGPELADRRRHPALAEAAAAPAARLAEMTQALTGAGRSMVSSETLGQAIWAFAHGVGTLALDGYLPRDGSTLDLAASGTRALIAGFATG